MADPFPIAASTHDLERGTVLAPRFDANGLIAAIATDAATGEVLMFAWMNAEALRLTMETNIAHYYSRSPSASGGRVTRSSSERPSSSSTSSVGIWLNSPP